MADDGIRTTEVRYLDGTYSREVEEVITRDDEECIRHRAVEALRNIPTPVSERD